MYNNKVDIRLKLFFLLVLSLFIIFGVYVVYMHHIIPKKYNLNTIKKEVLSYTPIGTHEKEVLNFIKVKYKATPDIEKFYEIDSSYSYIINEKIYMLLLIPIAYLEITWLFDKQENLLGLDVNIEYIEFVDTESIYY